MKKTKRKIKKQFAGSRYNTKNNNTLMGINDYPSIFDDQNYTQSSPNYYTQSSPNYYIPPNMLLCVIGGLTYTKELKDFQESSLGKTYKCALDEPNCHICIIDPGFDDGHDVDAVDSTLSHMVNLLNKWTKKSKQTIIKRIIHHKIDAVNFNFYDLLHQKKWSVGGICFALDIHGRDKKKYDSIRGNIWRELSRAITSKESVPATAFWNNLSLATRTFNPNPGWLLEYTPLDIRKLTNFQHNSLLSIKYGGWFITNPEPYPYNKIVMIHRKNISQVNQ